MDTTNASQSAAQTTLEQQLRRLQHENQALQQEIDALRLEKKQAYDAAKLLEPSPDRSLEPLHKVAQLTNPEIARYGRQLILPGFGIQGRLPLHGLLQPRNHVDKSAVRC